MEVASETVWSYLFLKVLNHKFKLFSRYFRHLFQLTLFFFFFFQFPVSFISVTTFITFSLLALDLFCYFFEGESLDDFF